MGTPWDAAAPDYLREWVPRIVPYHQDLVREVNLRPGARVLVPSAGPGAEVLAVARVIGPTGFIRASDKSDAMVRLCREGVARAALPTRVECVVDDAASARGGPWDAILCAFGLWQFGSRCDVLRAWAEELSPEGQVGIITWGPGERSSPFEALRAALAEIAPDRTIPDPFVQAEREPMAAMFAAAGLTMVRHTVVRHTLSFPTTAAFVRAMRDGCTCRRLGEELGDALFERVAVRFCEGFGGPHAALAFDPPATIAIGAAGGGITGGLTRNLSGGTAGKLGEAGKSG
jgi:ubiquinone/menaquinone biosynthesis C-methylase UbiE